MNPEVKAMWLDALRSGRYEQTQSTLCDGKGFCCLGVLTDLFLKENPNAGAHWANTTQGFALYHENSNGAHWEGNYLAQPVKKWAGLLSVNPKVEPAGSTPYMETSIPLSRLNDDGYSFDQIAECIERSL